MTLQFLCTSSQKEGVWRPLYNQGLKKKKSRAENSVLWNDYGHFLPESVQLFMNCNICKCYLLPKFWVLWHMFLQEKETLESECSDTRHPCTFWVDFTHPVFLHYSNLCFQMLMQIGLLLEYVKIKFIENSIKFLWRSLDTQIFCDLVFAPRIHC